MAEIRFNLKNKTTNEPTLILLIYRHRGKRIVVSTSKKVHRRHWNDREQVVRKSHPNSGIFNGYLKEMKSKADKILTGYHIEGKEYTGKEFKHDLEIEMGLADKKQKLTLFQFIDKFIAGREAIRPEGSIQVYRKTYNHLIAFANETKEYKRLDFNDIDMDFLKKFIAFLYSAPRSLSQNYSKKLLQNLKLFMNEAFEQEYHTNLKFKSRKFTISKEEVEKIYLTEEEIKKIYNTEFKSKRLERVRDLFVLNCYLGLRFSDLEKIKEENIEEINGKKILSVNTQKTKTNVKIPLKKEVIEILGKYDYQLPRIISKPAV
ncbi:MAG: site-specific integrase [Taibaiella sp.]|nr:site-specific integrase [Taibaiella sp.]